MDKKKIIVVYRELYRPRRGQISLNTECQGPVQIINRNYKHKGLNPFGVTKIIHELVTLQY